MEGVGRLLNDATDPPMAMWMLHKMRTLEEFGSKLLSEIVIPGSHNSATHKIMDDSFSAKFFGFLATTQDASVYRQMKVSTGRILQGTYDCLSY